MKGEIILMKKKITAMMLAMVAAVSLTACGKFTCDICGEEKSGKQYKAVVMDEEVVYCQDCKDMMDEVMDLFQESQRDN